MQAIIKLFKLNCDLWGKHSKFITFNWYTYKHFLKLAICIGKQKDDADFMWFAVVTYSALFEKCYNTMCQCSFNILPLLCF